MRIRILFVSPLLATCFTLWHYFWLVLGLSVIVPYSRILAPHTTEQNEEQRTQKGTQHTQHSTAAAVVSHGFGFPFGVDGFQSDRLAKGLKCLFWIWERDLRMRLERVAAGCCLNLKLKCGNWFIINKKNRPYKQQLPNKLGLLLSYRCATLSIYRNRHMRYISMHTDGWR